MLTVADPESEEFDLVFVALANSRRRQIVRSLGLQAASIGQLARAQNMSLPAIHRHVVVLEDAGLVQRRKAGRTNILALNRARLLDLQAWVYQFHAYWGTSGESLDNYVASIANADQPKEKVK